MTGLSEKVIVVRGDAMGQGNDELGVLLLGKFFVGLLGLPERPRAIFFYNSGVKLLTHESPVQGYLKELAERGVPIQACATCVDAFGLREALAVGEMSSMAQFVEYVRDYEIITL